MALAQVHAINLYKLQILLVWLSDIDGLQCQHQSTRHEEAHLSMKGQLQMLYTTFAFYPYRVLSRLVCMLS